MSGGSSFNQNGRGNSPASATGVAQLAEQRIPNPQVAGSSPSSRVIDSPRRAEAHGPLGIAKYGQGYWVRVMTAIAVAALFLAGAGWVWNKIEGFQIPAHAYRVSLENVNGTATPAQTVTLEEIVDNVPSAIGTANVAEFTTARSSASMTLDNIKLNEGKLLTNTKRVVITGLTPDSPALTAAFTSAQPIAAFSKLYIQIGAAALIIAIGLLVTWLYVARKPDTVDFLIATDGELKKVNWGTRKLIIDSTQVVVAATLLIAAYIFLVDVVFQKIAANWLGILGS